MKRFKVEKSRSSLWREAKNNATEPFSVTGDHEELHDVEGSAELLLLNEDPEIEVNTMTGENVRPLSRELPDFEVGGSRWLDDNDDTSDDETEGDNSLMRELAEWSVQNSISNTATGSLLSILRPHLPYLPQSATTLRHTLRDTSDLVKKIGGGEYCHLGLVNGLTQLVKHCNISESHLELQINVDGIPLFKSSSLSLWPILCLVKNIPYRVPFVIGMFCGKEKPLSASEFLADFVSEACKLLKDGLTVDANKKIVTIHSFVCDAPARAFLKGIKSHSGYNSCEKCTIRGQYDNKVTFPEVNCTLRTDESFNAMDDEDHHVGPCPLNPLLVGYVTQFGLDYMHLVCLGVMRRLILYWKGPSGPLHVRLGRQNILAISSRLLYLAQFVPVEFARKPRSLEEILRWKATEFREFLLYSGFTVLWCILRDDLYEHFLLLMVGIRILASKQLSGQYCDYAHALLLKFVSDAQVLYGNDVMVYNVHGLIHLANDVKNLECLGVPLFLKIDWVN